MGVGTKMEKAAIASSIQSASLPFPTFVYACMKNTDDEDLHAIAHVLCPYNFIAPHSVTQ